MKEATHRRSECIELGQPRCTNGLCAVTDSVSVLYHVMIK